MSFQKYLYVILFSIFGNHVFAQQMTLGKTPYLLNKSAVLELNADNQGLLLPRITDTTSINSLNPPDGMVIYFVPTKQFILRSNGYWKAMATTGNYLTGLSGDVTAAGPGNATATIANNVVSNSKFRQSVGLSVVGNATNATANVGDIVAANDGDVLRRTGTTLGFGQIATAGIANNAVTYQKLQNISTNNRLLGRATTGAGVAEEITLGTGLSLSGTTLNISSIPNSSLANSSINVSTGTTGTDFNVSGSPVSLGGTVTFNLPSASSAARGLLTSTDWTTFNNKQNALSFGNLTSSTTGVSITGGGGAVIGSGATVNIQNASSTLNGLLTSTDWTTFNNKLATTRTINTTAPLTGGGDLSADRTISMTQASATTNGWLSSADWNTFNNKQTSGNYITGLTGDVTATGPGAVAATISNSAVTYSKIQNVSTNNKLLGRATAGAGSVEEISLGSGLSMSGTNLNIGTVAIAQGGTGQTTANAALNALVPSQTGNAGAVLTTDGTNTSWTTISGVSTANYLFSYSTTAQSVTTAGTWQDITFSGGHPQLNGWTHSLTTNTQNFTCVQTGVYLVTFSAHIKNNDPNNPHEMDIRTLVNGAEVQGSVYSMDCFISEPNLSGTFLVNCNTGDILKLQMTGTSTQMQLDGGTYGTTKPTVTVNITRIK